jgi:hypothetical protein
MVSLKRIYSSSTAIDIPSLLSVWVMWMIAIECCSNHILCTLGDNDDIMLVENAYNCCTYPGDYCHDFQDTVRM